MSDIADDLAMRDVLARIDRQRAETEKFVAEQRKLMAEAQKSNRDPWILLAVALLGLLAAIAARLPELLRAFGATP